MRVCADHKGTGEGIILKHNLVDNTRAWSPETNVVLCTRCRQEIVHFLIDIYGTSEILFAADLGLDQVVTVHCCWRSYCIHLSRHELQDSHLCRCILTGDSVWTELEVGLSTLDFLVMRVVEMRVS